MRKSLNSFKQSQESSYIYFSFFLTEGGGDNNSGEDELDEDRELTWEEFVQSLEEEEQRERHANEVM